MQKPKQLDNKLKEKRPPADWDGLSNENRNGNLARMSGPTSFEKDEIDRDKKTGSGLFFRFNKHKRRDHQR